jgi:hypothetical protein
VARSRDANYTLPPQHVVNIVAGPYFNREHMTVVIVETERGDDLDAFLEASRLHQWNQC